jgi:hypothetical protein
MRDTGEGQGCPTDELRRQLAEERGRTDWLLGLISHHSSILARIEQRCMAIEARLGSAMTPTQWAKIATGLLLPLAVLLLTGNVELARKLMAP